MPRVVHRSTKLWSRTFDQIVCTEDPVICIPCFESQGKYCDLMCRQSTLKRSCVINWSRSSILLPTNSNETLTICALHWMQGHSDSVTCLLQTVITVNSLCMRACHSNIENRLKKRACDCMLMIWSWCLHSQNFLMPWRGMRCWITWNLA